MKVAICLARPKDSVFSASSLWTACWSKWAALRNKEILAKSKELPEVGYSLRLHGGGFGFQSLSPSRGQGLTGNALKMIAVLSMAIDHTFYALFDKMYISGKVPLPGLYSQEGAINTGHWIVTLQKVMRGIVGRIAFPIFCFLLVQGFTHTSNKVKYKLRLFVFALLSEIPFRLALWEELSFGVSNVLFTLLLGFISLEVLGEDWHVGFRALMIGGIAFFANALKCDYGSTGILLIILLYLAKDDRVMTVLVGVVSALALNLSVMSLLAYIPIFFYNGERGRVHKYFFYVFYPAHLIVLYIIRVAMLKN